jgi:hypothetical protein
VTYGQRYNVYIEHLVDGHTVDAYHENIDGAELEALRYEAANRGPEMLTFDVMKVEQ